jgi:spermidine synthase
MKTSATTVSCPTSVVLAGTALSSFSALLLELALTRLFSVVLFYHFAFLAISIALLGLGAGGVFAHLIKDRLDRIETRHLIAALCLINAVTVPLVLELVLHSSVSLDFTSENFLRLSAVYVVSAVPFFLTGVEFAALFARTPIPATWIYGADLLGGAVACILLVPLLSSLGGPNTVFFSALSATTAAMVWASSRKLKSVAIASAALISVAILANRNGKIADIVYAKGQLREKSWVEFARWNAISRVEVDRQNAARVIVIDADASTYIMNAAPGEWRGTTWEKNLMSAPPALVNILRPHGEYAIIGPGGGVDVLRALSNGSPRITGIEINPIIANNIMRGRYADYSYHLYQRPEVHLSVTDGRSFIRASRDQFDVLQMTLVDTWASTAAGAFALSENNLYTVEAFREYFEHLRPDGIVAITRWEFRQPREALRVVSVAMQALHDLGVADPSRNFIVVSEGELDSDGIPVAVLAKKAAFTDQEEEAVRRHLAMYPALTPLYLPSGSEPSPFSDLIHRNDPKGFAATYAYNVKPVYDNAPFFFFTLKLKQVLKNAGEDEGIDWKVNLGVAVLGMVLLISILAVIAFLIIPLAFSRAHHQPPVSLFYFVLLGLGYIMVEIAFIQRFVLFLGHPTYALTVVVFLLLLSSGIGSVVSRNWQIERSRLWIPLLVAAAAITILVGLLPYLLNALVGLPFAAKLVVSAALLVPLGFIMGMPFPGGLATLSYSRGSVEWAWAMNAGASVLGSVLAIVIAIQFGLNATLACGAIAYFFALALSRSLPPKQPAT